MIEPVADVLNIPIHRIYANTLHFHPDDGNFIGFDTSEPTSRDGGKPAVIQKLITAHGYGPIGNNNIVMVVTVLNSFIVFVVE